jgi:pimeloyl-ACP methyl ester carboxylesterase
VIPVVLAPGLLCDDRLWSLVRPMLKGEVVIVDFTDDETIHAMADRILMEGPDRFVLAGFSMGGMASMTAAARAPDRIAGLVLIDTHAEPETPDRSTRRSRQIATADAGGFERLVREELKPSYFADTYGRSGERRLVWNMALDAGASQFRRHVEALMARPDPGAMLGTLTMPVTVVTGEADTLAPPSAARHLVERLADARLVLVPDCGHMAPLEAPAVVAAEINRLCCKPEFA